MIKFRVKRLCIPAFLVISLFCSSFEKKGGDVKETLVIRYFSLSAVFNFIADRNTDYKSVVIFRDNLIKSAKNLEEQLLMADNKKDLIQRLKEEKDKLDKTDKEIAYIKSKIFNSINRSVKIVSDNIGADYILNLGDEVLYAKKKFDITEDIIREISRIEYRSLPVNR